MRNFSQILKKNGLKLFPSMFLGSLVASIPVFMINMIVSILGGTGGEFAAVFVSIKVLRDWHQTGSLELSALGEPFIVFSSLSISMMITVYLVLAFQIAGNYSVTIQALFQKDLDLRTYFNKSVIRTYISRSFLLTYFRKGLKYTWKLFLSLLLSTLFYLPLFLLFIIGFLWQDTIRSYIGLILILASIILSFVFSLMIMHVPVILIVEQTGIWTSYKLSFQLFRKDFRRVLSTFGYTFLVGLASIPVLLIIALAIDIPIAFLGAFVVGVITTVIGTGAESPFLGFILDTILLLIKFMTWLLGSLTMIVTTLIITYRYFKHLRQYISSNSISSTNN